MNELQITLTLSVPTDKAPAEDYEASELARHASAVQAAVRMFEGASLVDVSAEIVELTP